MAHMEYHSTFVISLSQSFNSNSFAGYWKLIDDSHPTVMGVMSKIQSERFSNSSSSESSPKSDNSPSSPKRTQDIGKESKRIQPAPIMEHLIKLKEAAESNSTS